jgi:serine phosphatase RsbU (regulator of sigma subunit)
VQAEVELPAGDAQGSAVLEELALAYEEIHFLHALSGALEDEVDRRTCLARVVECLRAFQAIDAVQVWVPSPDSEEHVCEFHWDVRGSTARPEAVPCDDGTRTLLAGLRVHVCRELPYNSAQPERVETFLAEILQRSGLPAVVAPLLSKSRMLGLFVARVPPTSRAFSASRLRAFGAAARQVGLALHLHFVLREVEATQGLQREIEIARQIQHGLLPQKVPQSPRFELFGGCVTAAQVGGDFYDFFEPEPDSLGILVADVAGHSVASALIAMSFRSTFRLFLSHGERHERLFELSNEALFAEVSKTDNFLSAFYATFHAPTGSFRYVNAGHNPGLVWSARRSAFLTLDEAGLLLGILPGQTYSAHDVQLEPGDVVVLYTDGIVEAENQRGELFGLERLKSAVRKHLPRSTREMYHYILKEMYLFQDERFNKDDVTLVILRVKAAPRAAE